ncbi:MAG: hypothetical protein FJX68_10590 [Alphaproteobacteria bacterium]|nr:hypothetical protein [Alphaproteobacteria bacterium]
MKRRPATETACKRPPAEDEAGLFDRAMQGTRQLHPAPARAKPAAVPAVPAAPAVRAGQPRAKPVAAAPAPPAPKPPPGLDHRTAQRLRRGQLPVDAKLDLHGYHQAAAHRALKAFVIASQAAGRRCVLLVHGRGEARGGEPGGGEGRGVLRRNVPRWLAEPELAQRILASAPARPEHGGSGALYLLLRRERGS